MHDARCVRCLEPADDLQEDRARGGPRKSTAGAEELLEVGAPEVLHDVVGRPVALAVVEDLHDVRVLDRRGGAGLREKPTRRGRVLGQSGLEDFDRDTFAQVQIEPLVDAAHTAASDLANQLVVVAEKRSCRTQWSVG